MNPIRDSVPFCALALLVALAGPLRAGDAKATEVCWRCRLAASCCEPAPRRCGPIRRLLGMCCLRPVEACRPCCPPATVVRPAGPPSAILPGGAPSDASPVGPAAPPQPVPPVSGSSYRPLTPPLPPPPVRLDRFVSFPGR